MDFGGAPKCPVCEKNVYFAEEVRAVGKAYHKMCLKCKSCHKLLDSTSVNDHGGNVYCRICYNKNFGPRGYGYAAGGAGLSTEGGDKLTTNDQSRQHYHTKLQNGNLLAGNELANGYYDIHQADGTDNWSMYRPPMHVNNQLANGASAGSLGGVASRLGVRSEVCANCAKAVYANERVDAVCKVFHRLCFKCSSCGRLLDRGGACDHAHNIFCRSCYNRLYGAKGVKAGTSMQAF